MILPSLFLSHIYLFPQTFVFHPLFSIFPLFSSKIFSHRSNKICSSSKSNHYKFLLLIETFIFKGRQHRIAMNRSALWSLILQLKPHQQHAEEYLVIYITKLSPALWKIQISNSESLIRKSDPIEIHTWKKFAETLKLPK